VGPQIESEKTNEPDLVDALKAVGPALGAAVSFEVAAKEFFGGRGALGLLIPIISAAGLLTVCIYLAFAKSKMATSDSARTFPRYPNYMRAIGFIGMVLLMAVVVVRIWKARPNFVHGQAYEAGFLCDAATGMPIGEGKVIVLSRGGRPMSQSQELDSRGFFYSNLKKDAFLPNALQVYSPACKVPGQIDLDSSEPGSCPASRDAPRNSTVVVHEWRAKCQ
jgi:hypothetical protein